MDFSIYPEPFDISTRIDDMTYIQIKTKLQNNEPFKIYNQEGINRYWYALLKSKILFALVLLLIFIVCAIYIKNKIFVPAIGLSSLLFLACYISFWSCLGIFREQSLYYTVFKERVLQSNDYENFTESMAHYTPKLYTNKYLLFGLLLLVVFIILGFFMLSL
jgi:hypothetical protein